MSSILSAFNALLGNYFYLNKRRCKRADGHPWWIATPKNLYSHWIHQAFYVTTMNNVYNSQLTFDSLTCHDQNFIHRNDPLWFSQGGLVSIPSIRQPRLQYPMVNRCDHLHKSVVRLPLGPLPLLGPRLADFRNISWDAKTWLSMVDPQTQDVNRTSLATIITGALLNKAFFFYDI